MFAGFLFRRSFISNRWKSMSTTETVEISMFAVGCFPCCGIELPFWEFHIDVFHNAVSLIPFRAFHERGLVSVKRDAVGSCSCRGKYFFSPCFGFSTSPRGIFPCNAIFAYPPFYAASRRLASAMLIASEKIQTRRVSDDKSAFKSGSTSINKILYNETIFLRSDCEIPSR